MKQLCFRGITWAKSLGILAASEGLERKEEEIEDSVDAKVEI